MEKLSKLLSYVLRHRPDEFGLELGEGGWVSIETLLEALDEKGQPTTREEISEVVRTSDKRRFAISPDGCLIRANQGHSVDVDLKLEPQLPPDVLFHGTVDRFLSSIRSGGLLSKSRHHVHLSPDEETARAVGNRRGVAVILSVDAKAMSAAGHRFYRSENGVWLTEHVPPQFLTE